MLSPICKLLKMIMRISYCFSDSHIAYYAASIRGLEHEKEKTENQDSFIAKTYSKGYVFAVSDGVGSCKYSSFGSKRVCKAVAKVGKLYLKGKITEKEIPQKIFYFYRKACVPKFVKKQMSATCIYLIASQEKVVLGQVGDGLCFVSRGEKGKALKMKDDDFTNIVSALNASRENTPRFTISHLHFQNNETFSALLCTDGISEDIKSEHYSEFLNECLKESQNNSGYLEKLLRNWPTPNSFDDKTAIIIQIKP